MLTANQNFRVGVSLDLSAARRAFRTLEAEFRELTFDIGGIGEADRGFRNLADSLKGIARDLDRIDRALTDTGQSAGNADTRIDKMIRSLKRLVAETADSRERLEKLAGSLKEIGGDLRAAGNAVAAFDRKINGLNINGVEQNMNKLARSVENLRERFDSSDDDARRLASEIRDLADATRALDRANDAAARSQGRVNGELRRKINRAGPGNIGGFVGIGAGGGFLGLGGSGLGFAGAAGVIALISQFGDVLFEATQRAGQFVAATAQIGAEFDLLIRRADVLAGGGGLFGFTQAALEQGRRTIFTARESANSLGELARAGFDVQESIAALPGVLDLAASDQVDLEKATLITARTLRAFRLPASDAVRVADILAETAAASATNVEELGQGLRFVSPIAAQLGESLEATAAAMGILGDRGFVAGIAGRALRRSLQVLADPSEKAAGALNKLGIEAFNAEGQFVGFEEIARQLNQAQIELGNNAEYTGLVFSAFGLRAAPQIIALADAVEEFGTRVDENFRSFGRAAEIAQLQLAGLQGSLVRLKSAFESEQIEAFIGSGLEQQFAAFVDDLRGLLPDLFTNIVDPVFTEIAQGTSLIRTNTIPDLIDAFEPVGEIISDTIGQVFDFIVENDEDLISAAIGVANAVQAIIDVFIGLGTVAAPILGGIADLLNALPDEIPSFLTGSGLGAVIGGVVGLIGGPGGAAIGAKVGAGAGGILGAIGASLRDRQTVERVLADFGVELGVALSDGFKQGLDLKDAIAQALQATTLLGGTNVDSLDKLRQSITIAEQGVQAAQRQFDLVSSRKGFRTTGVQVGLVTEQDLGKVFEQEQLIEESAQRLRRAQQNLGLAQGALQEFLGQEEITRLVESEIARGNAFLAQLEAVGGAITSFRLETDPQKIIESLIAGETAIDRVVGVRRGARGVFTQIPTTIEDLGDEVEAAFRDFQEKTQSSLATIVDTIDQGTLDLIDGLTNFGATIDKLQADLSGPLFTDVGDLQEQLKGSFALDFSEIFDTESGELPGFTAGKKILVDLLTAIPEEAAAEASQRIDSIFADEALTPAERFLAAATVVDQAVLEQRAQELADLIEGVFDRSQAMIDEAEALKARTAGRETVARLLPEEDRAVVQGIIADETIRTEQLQNQAQILLELVNSGDLALAQMATISDAVLSAVTDNSLALDDQQARLEALGEEVEIQLGIVLSDESVQALVAEVNEALSSEELAAGAEAGAEGVADAFMTPLEGLPQAVKDLFGISSPSTVFKEIGIALVQGLQIGWTLNFPSLKLAILSDIESLVLAIERSLSSLNISPTVNTTGTGGGGRLPVFHSGGLIPGGGNVPILAQGGEFMLRRAAVDYLKRSGVDLAAANRDPRRFLDPVSMHQATTYSRTTDMSRHASTVHNHNYTIGAGVKVNERRMARGIERAFKGIRV